MKATSIWSTLEIDCASSGFPYSDYVDLHSKATDIGAILSESGYNLVVQLFDNEYTEYCKSVGSLDELLEELE